MNDEERREPAKIFAGLGAGDIFADYAETEASRQARKRPRKFKRRHAEQLTLALLADLCQVRAIYGPPMDETSRDSYYAVFLAAFEDRWVRQFEFGYERFGIPTMAWRYTVQRDEKEWHCDQPGIIDTTLSIPKGSAFFMSTCECPGAHNALWDVDCHYLAGDTHVYRQALH